VTLKYNLLILLLQEHVVCSIAKIEFRILSSRYLTQRLLKSCATRTAIFDKHYLDVESLFEKAGWKVVHERPCAGEDFEIFFKFTKG